MFRTVALWVAVMAAVGFYSGQAQAQLLGQEMTIGYRSLVTWLPGDHLKADIAVWYPAQRSVGLIRVGSWSFRAARNAPVLSGNWPVLLLSHASSGSRFSHHDLAADLVRKGYIVAALTHEGDTLDDLRLLFTARQLPMRARQLSAALDVLLESPELAPHIDAARIGVIGFGNGGAAALLLAGALQTGAHWPGYCPSIGEQALSGDLPRYCSPVMARNMEKLMRSLDSQTRMEMEARTNWEKARQLRTEALDRQNAGIDQAYPRVLRAQKRPAIQFPKPPAFLPLLPPLPEKAPLTDSRFKALALISPGYSMLFDSESLLTIKVPVLLLGAEQDSLNRPEEQAQQLWRWLPQGRVEYSLLKEADLTSVQAPCPPDMARDLPALCISAPAAKRTQIRSKLEAVLTSFFQRALP